MEKMAQREGRQREYKEQLSDYKGIIRTAVAFSNDIGGVIAIGVRDGSCEVLGLTDQEVERYLEEIPRALFDAITPACRPLVTPRIVAGKKVVEIEVFPGSNKPYYVIAQGLERGVFIRVGAHTKRANEEIVRDLQRERERRFFDEELVTHESVDALDSLSLRSFYGSAVLSNEVLLADKVIGLASATRLFHPTMAGVLFFHHKPAMIVPGAEILFSHLAGKDLSSVVMTRDISLPIPIMVREVLNELEGRLATAQERLAARLTTKQSEIPEDAIREALLNALVHRKYTIPDAVKVALFSDRLEIFSPGNFPGPITDLRSGVSYTRNPTVRQLARRMGLVEKRGWGLQLIFSACAKNGNPEPLIEEGPDFVKVTLWRHRMKPVQVGQKVPSPASQQLSLLPASLLPLKDLLSSRESLHTHEVMLVLKCSENTARTRIKELIKRGVLIAEGEGRGRRYRVITKIGD